ncbi:Aldo/keto reductase [Peniophora sp. CONT]|nr:Aldo/keto reductase [Peniophora sp. CONT]
MSSPIFPRKIPYVRLGKSGLKISRIILGCMSYGSSEWMDWVLDEEEGIKHIKAAYDAGIQTFDTANVYSAGLSEVVLGKAIKQHKLPRDEIVVMTKLFAVTTRTPGETSRFKDPNWKEDENGYVNQHGLSRKHIFESVKHSLERLQLDYIDLLQCHRFDYDTPIEETMQALHDVVKAGYVRYIGMSSCYAWQFCAMQSYAIQHGLTPFISMQNHYSLIYREEEREMMGALKHYGVGSIPWSPLARGLLTRPVDKNNDSARNNSDPGVIRFTKAYLGGGGEETIKRVEELAKKKSCSMAQLSLAWMLHKDVVSAPIIGTTSLEKLADLLGALDVKLNADEMKYLEELYEPKPVLGVM